MARFTKEPAKAIQSCTKKEASTAAKIIWRWLYFAICYGCKERPLIWAIGPHPRWLNKICEFLYIKWMAD